MVWARIRGFAKRETTPLKYCGEMAEWSNAPDSKSGVLVFQYRGFESLSLRHRLTPDPMPACRALAYGQGSEQAAQSRP